VSARRIHRPRVIPVLLLRDGLLYKTRRFRDPKYVGDPRIAVKIFSDKCADELVLLDIGATPQGRGPDFALIAEIVTESFMPIAYGGGVRSVQDARTLLKLGVEKVVVNAAALERPSLFGEIAAEIGSSSVVCAIDPRKTLLGGYICTSHSGQRRHRISPVDRARAAEAAGAGEILVNCVDRDGTFAGYDLSLIKTIAAAVKVPVIACGGARSVADCVNVVGEGQASAAAAGSIFVFQGPHRAVLITFPSDADLRRAFEAPPEDSRAS
jgi:imidazole glycerol-phosphate synthase subunit HisF